jgi:hypothetical protein
LTQYPVLAPEPEDPHPKHPTRDCRVVRFALAEFMPDIQKNTN